MNTNSSKALPGLAIVTWMLLLVMVGTWQPAQAKEQAGRSIHLDLFQSDSLDCSQLIAELKSKPDWLDRLYDPILKTNKDVVRTTEEYSKIFDCLIKSQNDLSDEERQILRLTGYFLMFVDGLYSNPGGRHLELIDLGTVDDPAVSKFTQEVDIPAPEGFVFVNLFDSVDSMPEPIREIFSVRNVAGVTVFSRYIAVLDEKKSTWYEQALKSQVLPTTISHELIHAYVNSAIGIDAYSEIPTWFHEGVAIYFSNSGENRAVITPNFTLYITPPADYQQYALNFKYLEHELGTDLFLSRIQEVIETRSIGSLFVNMPFNSEDELPLFAASWQQQNHQSRLIAGTIILLIVAYFIFSGQVSEIPLPVKRCQGCGRIFPVWQNSHLREYHPPYRLWKEGTEGPQYPYSIHATLVCQSCIDRSSEINEIYASRIRGEIQLDSEIASVTYDKWLSSAPVLDPDKDPPLKVTKGKMITYFTQAALLTKYSPVWLDTSIQYEFSDIACINKQDMISTPPPSYTDVLQLINPPNPDQTQILGSVYQTIDHFFVIDWVTA